MINGVCGGIFISLSWNFGLALQFQVRVKILIYFTWEKKKEPYKHINIDVISNLLYGPGC